MASIEEIQALVAMIADALGAGEGAGAGAGDYNDDTYADNYGTFGQGTNFSLYKEVLAIKTMLQNNLDVPVSSREAALKLPGPGPYFVGRVVKESSNVEDGYEGGAAISNALVEARYSGTDSVIRSTRTNSLGRFVLFFADANPVDITITSDHHQGTVLYGVVPQVY